MRISTSILCLQIFMRVYVNVLRRLLHVELDLGEHMPQIRKSKGLILFVDRMTTDVVGLQPTGCPSPRDF